MKKIILLFTILCASQLYVMEPEQQRYINSLPLNVQSLITGYVDINDRIAVDDKVTEIIKATKNQITNLDNFTALVHVLGERFHMPIISKLFPGEIAAEYNRLSSNQNIINPGLVMSIYKKGLNEPVYHQYIEDNKPITKLIDNIDENIRRLVAEGADVNYNTWTFRKTEWAPLPMAIKFSDLETVALLLASGAKPTKYTLEQAKEIADKNKKNTNTFKIKELIENAMKK